MTNRRVQLLAEHGATHEWIDNQDGTFTAASHQDVAPFMDRNKAIATLSPRCVHSPARKAAISS
jgi:hypothetical protein